MYKCGQSGGDTCSLHGCQGRRNLYRVCYSTGKFYENMDLCTRAYNSWKDSNWIIEGSDKNLTVNVVVSTPAKDGEWCCKCSRYYKQAIPNQEDGTLICYTCRKYPFYR